MSIPTLIHVCLMALMVLLCSAAAFVAWRRGAHWFPRHRLLGLSGAGSGLAGLTVMIVQKIQHGYPHFASPHAIIGLSAGILLVIVPALGYFGARGQSQLKLPHRYLARLLILLSLTALLIGVIRYFQLSKPAPAATPPAAS